MAKKVSVLTAVSLASFLASYAVRNDSGDVDLEKTTDKFREDLEKYAASENDSTEQFKQYVNAVYDSSPGVAITKPVLVSLLAAKACNNDVVMMPAFLKKAEDFIASNTQGESIKDENNKVVGYQRPDSFLVMSFGHGGGIKRRSDLKQESDSNE